VGVVVFFFFLWVFFFFFGGGGAAPPPPPPPPASVLAVESLLSVPGSAQRSLGGGWRVKKEYDLVHLEQGASVQPPVPEPVSLPVPGRAEWGVVTVVVEPVEGFRAVEVAHEAIIDAECVTGPLILRGPRIGDRLQPLGAPGTRKLKEVLIDTRVPARERSRTPLVVCDERILWVCGLVVAEEARVTRETRRFLRLSVQPIEEGATSCGP
jgi:tRNA(Ile)-lysidine synthetase-like protein